MMAFKSKSTSVIANALMDNLGKVPVENLLYKGDVYLKNEDYENQLNSCISQGARGYKSVPKHIDTQQEMEILDSFTKEISELNVKTRKVVKRHAEALAKVYNLRDGDVISLQPTATVISQCSCTDERACNKALEKPTGERSMYSSPKEMEAAVNEPSTFAMAKSPRIPSGGKAKKAKD